MSHRIAFAMTLLIKTTTSTSNNIGSAIRFSAFHNSTRRSHRWCMNHNNTSGTTMVVTWNIHQHNRQYSSQTCYDCVLSLHRFKLPMAQNITSLLEFSSHQRHYSLSLSTRSYRSSCSSKNSSSSSSSSSIQEPLNSLTTWNSNVTWGTKQQPLMVKVNNSVAVVGKCGML